MVLVGKSGKRYRVVKDDNARAGGEGTVFRIEGEPNLVVKIYHQPTTEREKKILRMLSARPARTEDFAWPLDVIYSTKGGRFLGFVMQKVEGVPLRDIIVYDKRASVPWSFYVMVAANIATAVQSLHEAGHVVGDLNPNNVLVDTKTGIVKLIDTDSFHITDPRTGEVFRCEVGQPECLAPELQSIGRSPNESFRTIRIERSFNVDTDLFSLALMIFRTLMNGAHPFNSVIKGVSQSSFTCEDRIEQGVCAFFPETAKANSSLPAYAPPIDALPQSTQDMFRRVFVYRTKGAGGSPQIASSTTMKSFFSAGASSQGSSVVSMKGRPLGKEWRKELLALCAPNADCLVRCKAVPSHEYPRERKSCPWCEADRRLRKANSPVSQRAYIPPKPMAAPRTSAVGFSNSRASGTVGSLPKSVPSSSSSTSSNASASGSAKKRPLSSLHLPRPSGRAVKVLAVVVALGAILHFFNIDILGFIGDTAENLSLEASRSSARSEAPLFDDIPMASDTAAPLFPAFAKIPEGSIYGDYGYINSQGEWVLMPTLDDEVISVFSEGLALSFDSLSDLYGYVDVSGEYAIRPSFVSAASTFSDGVAWVKTGSAYGSNYIFIDKAGNQILNDSWRYVTDFSDGKAWVYKSSKNAYYKNSDYKGPVIINKSGQLVGFLNSNGNAISADDVQAFNSGRARVEISGKYGFADESGTVVIQPVYAGAASFSEGLAAVYDANKKMWGYIDTVGNVAIVPQFKKAGPFREGLASVETDAGYGYIDPGGQFVIAPQYMIACEFSGGYAPVKDRETSLYTLIDKEGNQMFPPRFTLIRSSMVFRERGIQTPETGTL